MMTMNPQPQLTLEGSLRVLRVMHISFVVAALLIIYVGEKAGPHDAGTIQSAFLYILALAAGASAVFGWMFQKKMNAAAEQQSSSGMPIEQTSLQRRQAGYMIAFACALSVIVYGFVLIFEGLRGPKSCRFTQSE
jgi:hypothetical protein